VDSLDLDKWINAPPSDSSDEDVSSNSIFSPSADRAAGLVSRHSVITSVGNLCQPFDAHCYMDTATKHPVCQTGLRRRRFLIFDVRALWRSGLSVRVPGCQKLEMTANSDNSAYTKSVGVFSLCRFSVGYLTISFAFDSRVWFSGNERGYFWLDQIWLPSCKFEMTISLQRVVLISAVCLRSNCCISSYDPKIWHAPPPIGGHQF